MQKATFAPRRMDTSTDILSILRTGKVTIQGEFIWGSNFTFLAKVESSEGDLVAVYKPNRGQRPLWDFPVDTLARREVAAYIVSEEIGWRMVPDTVYRTKGPLGSGSLQLFIDHDPEYHYFNFPIEERQRLRPVVLLDIIINNADRKGSHVLRDPDGNLWLIDHGICFHVEDKLRTVIWDFMGQPIPENLYADLNCFVNKLKTVNGSTSNLNTRLFEYLDLAEIGAIISRTENLIHTKHFPEPDPHRRGYPWPQL